jgi:hypothetical protein
MHLGKNPVRSVSSDLVKRVMTIAFAVKILLAEASGLLPFMVQLEHGLPVTLDLVIQVLVLIILCIRCDAFSARMVCSETC